MKNSKMNKALNSILPTALEKQKILNNILKPKKNLGFKLAPIVAMCFLCIITYNLVNNTSSNEGGEPIMPLNLTRKSTINYNGNQYCEDGIWTDISGLKKMENNILSGGVVYKTSSDDILVIYDNDVYKKFSICK